MSQLDDVFAINLFSTIKKLSIDSAVADGVKEFKKRQRDM